MRVARNGDHYALITSQVFVAVQTARSNAEARAKVEDDAQLLGEIARKADDDAARRLYRKYRMELFRYGVHVLHDQGLAEEMVQETLHHVLPAGQQLRRQPGPRTSLAVHDRPLDGPRHRPPPLVPALAAGR